MLTSLFLSDGEYEVYGYYTATKLKFIMILSQKSNLSNYEERLIRQVINIFISFIRKNLF